MPFMTPNRPAPIDFVQIKADNALPGVVAASVKIIKTGKEFKARCPFHDDRSPSLTLYNSGGWRLQCFRCGVGGDVIDWVAKFNKTSVIDASYNNELLGQEDKVIEPLDSRENHGAAATVPRLKTKNLAILGTIVYTVNGEASQ